MYLYPNTQKLSLFVALQGKGDFLNVVGIMDLELGKLPWLIWVSSVHCFEADDPC